MDKDVRIIRIVIDALYECNLDCLYCHPRNMSQNYFLPKEKIAEIFKCAEENNVLEITLTGGEIFLHHEIEDVFNEADSLNKTNLCIITNATLISDETARMISFTAYRQSPFSSAVSYQSFKSEGFMVP